MPAAGSHRGEPASRLLGGGSDQGALGNLEDGHGVVSRDARELLEELIQRVPCLEVIDERLDRDARTCENCGAA